MFKFNMNLIGNLNKIVAYPDAMIEVKYRIGNRYKIASKAVEGSQYSCAVTIHYGGPNPGIWSLLLHSNLAILSS